MDPLTATLFVAGVVLLIVGAEGLVRGASHLAVAMGVSPLVVGLTIVAFGTGSPELAVAFSSALGGEPDIAVGNVVGSNIFNILLILGLAAVIAPLVVAEQLVRLDVPLMIGASLLLLLFSLDHNIGRAESAVFVLGIGAYLAWTFFAGRRQGRDDAGLDKTLVVREVSTRAVLADLGMVVGGLALLILGSTWLVDGAVSVAEALGVSQLIIGLTIVAAGTSLPEVATSVLASFRGERDIAVGNVVGSNLFNILAVLGITGLVAEGGIAVANAALTFDIPVMLAVAVACLPIYFTGREIARWEGGLFLAYFVAYMAYLLLDATGHDALEPYSVVMLGFVVPITAVTLAVLGLRALHRERRAQ